MTRQQKDIFCWITASRKNILSEFGSGMNCAAYDWRQHMLREHSTMGEILSGATDPLAARRRFLRGASLAAFGALAGSAMPFVGSEGRAEGGTITDGDILNFALNLEYLEAEFYNRAAFGRGLAASDTSGTGTLGAVTGGSQVPFDSMSLKYIAEEIAEEELAHVRYLRKGLGSAKVARPRIDFAKSFGALAKAAGITGTFDPFADESSFLVGAFIFEDVGVTAYHGAAPLITSKAYLTAAAGILATEAYHAGTIRTLLYTYDIIDAPAKIAALRRKVDGTNDDDYGVMNNGATGPATIAVVDANGIAFSRTPQQVLDVVYAGGTSKGGFFPNGVNGTIR